jgi:hypothetical protein
MGEREGAAPPAPFALVGAGSAGPTDWFPGGRRPLRFNPLTNLWFVSGVPVLIRGGPAADGKPWAS